MNVMCNKIYIANIVTKTPNVLEPVKFHTVPWNWQVPWNTTLQHHQWGGTTGVEFHKIELKLNQSTYHTILPVVICHKFKELCMIHFNRYNQDVLLYLMAWVTLCIPRINYSLL